MAIKLRTRTWMAAIGLLYALMALPFQCETPQSEVFRKRATRLDELATEYRTAERRARAAGDVATAERHRAHADRLERDAWIHRRASDRYRDWPDFLRPRRSQ